jgi:hypothetical protein
MNCVAQPSRLRVAAASRRQHETPGETPGELAGEDAYATFAGQFMVPGRDFEIVKPFHEPSTFSEGLSGARSVWSASGLPALWHVRKAGASSPHSKRCCALMLPLRFMAPTHVNILEVFAFHEPALTGSTATSCPRPGARTALVSAFVLDAGRWTFRVHREN